LFSPSFFFYLKQRERERERESEIGGRRVRGRDENRGSETSEIRET
jgi:hypothetical protein